MVNSRIVAIELPDGAKLGIEATELGKQSDIETERAVAALPTAQLSEILAPIESLARQIAGLLERVGPSEAAVEFGVEIGVEAGQLTALLVKGTGKANLKVTLTWEDIKQHATPRIASTP